MSNNKVDFDISNTMNLLEEAIKELRNNGKDFLDVKYVNCKGKTISWREFCNIANYYTTDSYGIDSTLKIVGENWWLERAEYAGGACFHILLKFKTYPVKYDNSELLTTDDIFNGYFDSKI